MYVCTRESIDVAHVEPLGRGIREHHELVIRVLGGLELLQRQGVRAALLPFALPPLLDGGRVVAVPLSI